MRIYATIILFLSLGLLFVCCSDSSSGDGNGDSDSDSDGDIDGEGTDDLEDIPPEPDWDNISVEIEGDWDPDSTMGPQTPNEYTPDDTNSDSVSTDQIGRLILNSEGLAGNPLWVSNSEEGTVSMVDTTALVEVARYHSGNSDAADPSRTSVDLAGDVFVGNRNKPSSVTKIAGSPDRCVDRNGNGTIETSSGPTDVYPRAGADDPYVPEGQSTDECVVWTHLFDEDDLPCEGPRGVASTAETGQDFEYNGHVWIGCRDSNTIFKLNGNTGETIVAYGPFDGENGSLNVSPYGFVLDKDGRIWISGRGGSGLDGVYWMDTATGEMTAALGPNGEGPVEPYGIAIDDNGYIWIATKNDGSVWRYQPGPAPSMAGGTWDSLVVSDSFRGIAVDVDGFVWAIDTSGNSEIYLVDPDRFPAEDAWSGPYFLGSSDVAAEKGTGAAIDFSGHVWGISGSGCITDAGDMGCASRLVVTRNDDGTIEVAEQADIVPVGKGPYVYSDMIGYNLRNYATKEGWYRQVFDVCNNSSTRWREIAFNADTPEGTHFIIRARTADQKADLRTADWYTVVRVPTDASPVALPTDLPEGHFIELEVRLYTQRTHYTPAVGQIGFSYDCTYEVDVSVE